MAERRVHVFQHVACEDLGSFAEVLERRHYQPIYTRFFAGDPVPQDWETGAALVVLGGPMSANDEDSLPYLQSEKRILRQAIRNEHPVLGICLGSQLLAAAGGARVFQGARPEIGWAPISLTLEGRQDPLLRELAALPSAFHWHGETFDLPPGATRLAFSGLTMNQAFRLGTNAYGLQFHVEVDARMIQAWVKEYPNDLGVDARGTIERIAVDSAQYVKALRSGAAELLGRFLDLVERRAGRSTAAPGA